MVEIFDNIRKIYTFSPPCEALRDYVEFFSESSAEATGLYFNNCGFNVKMFASYTPTFWINLGPAYHLNINGYLNTIPSGNDILVVRDGVTERINHPADHIFTVKFFPGGLEAVLGVSQAAMGGQAVLLSKVLPVPLLLQVKQAADFITRMHLLQQYFLQRLTKIKACYYIGMVRDTIAVYRQGELQYNVSQLAARAFVTSKSINRYFSRVVGITPKQYLSVLRARTALSAFIQDSSSFTPEDFGYYDVSHFYRGITKFTGRKLTLHRA